MSPKIKYPSHHSLVHKDAFDLLPRIRDAKFDFSSANVLPEKPIHLFHVYKHRDSEFQEALMSKDASHPRGSIKFLKACADFFVRHGFDRETLYRYSGPEDKREEFIHISATPGILKSIEIIYDRICLDEAMESEVSATGSTARELAKFHFKKDKNTVMVFAPTFGYYLSQILSRNMQYSIFQTKEENGFLPTLQELEELDIELSLEPPPLATPASLAPPPATEPTSLEPSPEATPASLEPPKLKPKVFLLCYPNNPTGEVMTKEVAAKLVEIARKHNILIISDEVYINSNLYGQKKSHFSIGSIPGALSNVITLTNLSKSNGLAGIETGMAVGNSEIIKIFSNFQGYTGVDQLLIVRAIAIDEETDKYHTRVKEGYQANVSLLNEFIAKFNKNFSKIFQCPINIKPKVEYPKYGNIYLLDFSDLKGKYFNGRVLETGLDITKFLYETISISIAVVPGECFLFEPEEMLIRISLGHGREKFIEALQALDSYLEEFAKMPQLTALSGDNLSVSTLQTEPQRRDSDEKRRYAEEKVAVTEKHLHSFSLASEASQPSAASLASEASQPSAVMDVSEEDSQVSSHQPAKRTSSERSAEDSSHDRPASPYNVRTRSHSREGAEDQPDPKNPKPTSPTPSPALTPTEPSHNLRPRLDSKGKSLE